MSLALKQRIIGKIAEYMVKKNDSPPSIAKVKKPLSESRVAFISTSGVHLRSDRPFNLKGDHSFRLIPRDSLNSDLTISHDHYDKTDALKDINCVFPLEILRDLESEGFIAELAPRHFGLMGYIPRVDLLVNRSIPQMMDMLLEDGVDILLLSPG